MLTPIELQQKRERKAARRRPLVLRRARRNQTYTEMRGQLRLIGAQTDNHRASEMASVAAEQERQFNRANAQGQGRLFSGARRFLTGLFRGRS